MKEPTGPDQNEPGGEAARTFGLNVRAARIRAGLSQHELAEQAGVARSAPSMIEIGSRNLTFRTAEAIAQALGMTLLDLLRPTGSELDPQEEPVLSGKTPPKQDTLAIELPRGQAFEVAYAAAKQLGQAIVLVDPSTREIAGVASRTGKSSED